MSKPVTREVDRVTFCHTLLRDARVHMMQVPPNPLVSKPRTIPYSHSRPIQKDVTLHITTGTPLDITSNIVQSYIQGREINMVDIHKFCFEKYMQKIRQQAPKKNTP